MPADPTEAIALFRYRVVAEATNERLSPAERGLVVRELAARLHELPDGSRKEFSRATLDRWIRACRAEGLDGLRPAPRSDIGTARVAPELIEEACALRRELPVRSAEQISRILRARHSVRVAPRTIREHLRRRGLDRARLTAEPRVFGRYEAEHPNERWIGDVLVGPFAPPPGPRQPAGVPVPARRRPLAAPAPRPLDDRGEHPRRPGGAPGGDPAPGPA